MSPWLIIVIVVALAGGLSALAIYAYRIAALTTEITRWPVHGHPREHGLAYEDVTFPSLDSLALKGWYLPAGDDSKCVIFIQGEEHHRNSPGIDALGLATNLVSNNYSVLLFDLRGRGESEGARGSAGNLELDDTLGAIAYVRKRGVKDGHFALLGFSLGAGLAICAAGREPKAVGAVITDSAFKDLLEDYRWPLTPIIRLMGRLFFKSDPGLIRPIKVVPTLRQPILFIHGEKDSVLAASESKALYKACASPTKELWIVPKAEHVQSYRGNKTEYVEKVGSFLQKPLS